MHITYEHSRRDRPYVVELWWTSPQGGQGLSPIRKKIQCMDGEEPMEMREVTRGNVIPLPPSSVIQTVVLEPHGLPVFARVCSYVDGHWIPAGFAVLYDDTVEKLPACRRADIPYFPDRPVPVCGYFTVKWREGRPSGEKVFADEINGLLRDTARAYDKINDFVTHTNWCNKHRGIYTPKYVRVEWWGCREDYGTSPCPHFDRLSDPLVTENWIKKMLLDVLTFQSLTLEDFMKLPTDGRTARGVYGRVVTIHCVTRPYVPDEIDGVPTDQFTMASAFAGDCEDSSIFMFHLMDQIRTQDWDSKEIQRLKEIALKAGTPVAVMGRATSPAIHIGGKRKPHETCPHMFVVVLPDELFGSGRPGQESIMLEGTAMVSPFYHRERPDQGHLKKMLQIDKDLGIHPCQGNFCRDYVESPACHAAAEAHRGIFLDAEGSAVQFYFTKPSDNAFHDMAVPPPCGVFVEDLFEPHDLQVRPLPREKEKEKLLMRIFSRPVIALDDQPRKQPAILPSRTDGKIVAYGSAVPRGEWWSFEFGHGTCFVQTYRAEAGNMV